MDDNFLKGYAAVSSGPIAKENFLNEAENEYNNENFLNSIFYQIRALYQTFQERYYQITTTKNDAIDEDSMAEMDDWEKENLKVNPLMRYAIEQVPASRAGPKAEGKVNSMTCNFLHNITKPLEGIEKIKNICQQMPKEWTIIQLCKGQRSGTPHSIFPQIHEDDAAIYFTILKHARSAQYSTPICLRFSTENQAELFKEFASIATKFKQCINVDPTLYHDRETKKMYWDYLDKINQDIENVLKKVKEFFFPWNCLFSGLPRSSTIYTMQYVNDLFKKVDELCNKFSLNSNECVLLSMVVLNIQSVGLGEINGICDALITNTKEKEIINKFLIEMKDEILKLIHNEKESGRNESTKYYPCILIVDERLDHFFWEEMNVNQEFCRISSLQCLWHLFQLHKEQIINGYLRVDITNGGCILNPDNNLPKTEMRMKSFFEHWTPHWLMKFTQRPTQDEMLNDFFKRPCYVYAGHGSGLQYMNGKYIARHKINSVVFLFGCDSTRIYSNGLYSELLGPHLYYHAGSCPSLVGTLMPGLDAQMDHVATDILSRWIASKNDDILVWRDIDRLAWTKEGIIKPKQSKSVRGKRNYHIGSLCAIISRIHKRITEPKLYNTVPYVCRGLPAWNINVEKMTSFNDSNN